MNISLNIKPIIKKYILFSKDHLLTLLRCKKIRLNMNTQIFQNQILWRNVSSFLKINLLVFFKDDSSMGSAKDSEDGKSICAGERQDLDEDITSKDFEFHNE